MSHVSTWVRSSVLAVGRINIESSERHAYNDLMQSSVLLERIGYSSAWLVLFGKYAAALGVRRTLEALCINGLHRNLNVWLYYGAAPGDVVAWRMVDDYGNGGGAVELGAAASARLRDDSLRLLLAATPGRLCAPGYQQCSRRLAAVQSPRSSAACSAAARAKRRRALSTALCRAFQRALCAR